MKLQKQLNNKGFSLVELLIATVILAIIVAPLLHTFVFAATTTARSRKISDATLASQNIAEAIEANSIETLGLNPGYAHAQFAGWFDSAAGTNSIAYEAGAEKYHLSLTNLRVGSTAFDAMVTFDADPHTAVNDELVVDYSKMNMDAVYAQSRESNDPDAAADSAFREHANRSHADWDSGSYTVERTITLAVGRNGDATKINAQLTYAYKFNYTYYVENIDPSTGVIQRSPRAGEWSVTSLSRPMFDGGFDTPDSNTYPNIYVMYYPLYGGTEEIIIRNEKDLPFRLFLVKQKDTDVTWTDLTTKEPLYSVSIQQVVSDTDYSAEEKADHRAAIYSNAAENLCDGSPITGVHYQVKQGLWVIDDTIRSFSGRDDGHHDLAYRNEKNRLYQVTIRVFEQGADYAADQPLYTTTTTKLQ